MRDITSNGETKPDIEEKMESDLTAEDVDENREQENDEKNVEAGEDDRRVSRRRSFLVFAVVAQILVFIFMLYKFSIPENKNIMLMETPIIKNPEDDVDNITIRSTDIIDTITFLTGGAIGGVSKENRLRKKMAADSGQAMWILIKDQPKENDELLKYAEIALGSRDYDQFKKNILKDDVVNFFYDLAKDDKAFANNWSVVGVEELKASPLLPWKKKVDFMVLSSFEKRHWGGLKYIIRKNPGLPVLCPVAGKETILENKEIFDRVQNLVSILPGYTQLTGRLGALVMPVKIKGKQEPVHELVLVISLEDGTAAVVAGAGLARPYEVIRAAKKATGKKITYYAGGTNLDIALENPKIVKDLEKAKDEAKDMDIYPNFNTSILAHQMLKKVFGKKYHVVPLGYKIRLRGEKAAKGSPGKAKTSDEKEGKDEKKQ